MQCDWSSMLVLRLSSAEVSWVRSVWSVHRLQTSRLVLATGELVLCVWSLVYHHSITFTYSDSSLQTLSVTTNLDQRCYMLLHCIYISVKLVVLLAFTKATKVERHQQTHAQAIYYHTSPTTVESTSLENTKMTDHTDSSSTVTYIVTLTRWITVSHYIQLYIQSQAFKHLALEHMHGKHS